MPSLLVSNIEEYSNFKTLYFVETGTLEGETVSNVLHYFEKLFTIEINSEFVKRAIQKFKNIEKVNVLEGDSSRIIGPLCRSLDKPTFFWLDGHWSGGDTGRGEKDCPLIEELEQIMENCVPECIIAIDDVRLFKTNIDQDWSNITRENVLDVVKSRLVSCKYYPSQLYEEDRMVLTLNKKE